MTLQSTRLWGLSWVLHIKMLRICGHFRAMLPFFYAECLANLVADLQFELAFLPQPHAQRVAGVSRDTQQEADLVVHGLGRGAFGQPVVLIAMTAVRFMSRGRKRPLFGGIIGQHRRVQSKIMRFQRYGFL